MGLSAREAAKAAGKAVTTITRAIENGKLSASRTDGGGYAIEPSELFRVFPKNSSATPKEIHSATQKDTGENRALQREVELLREALADARQERDRWRDMADRLAIAPPAPTPTPMPSLWQRLFGK
jgi:hypothetical protein